MTEQEQEFSEWLNRIEEIANQYDISMYDVVGVRQIWDFGYNAGKMAMLKESLANLEGKINA